MSKELKEIIEQLNTLGSNSFYDGIDKKNIIDFEDKNNIRLIRDLQDDLKSNMEMVDKTLVLRPQRQYHLWRGRP